MGVVRLIGEHVSYSASPPMQYAGFAALGLDHRYEIADVGADDLERTLDLLRDGDCLGANVTVPHKAAAAGLVDELDDLAERAGAINTIVNRNGRLSGTNTDVPALVDQIALVRAQPPTHAVVLGAGGAARAAALALVTAGVQRTTLVSRRGGVGSAPWSALGEAIADAELLINATPVGTQSDETPVPAALLHEGLALLDLVYRPSPTRLVRDARGRGLSALSGAGVLHGQGWRSLEAWLGRPVTNGVRTAMASALRSELGAGVDV